MATAESMGTTAEYTKCGNALDAPGAPEGVRCERPRGHAWLHRKTIGGATLTWPNTGPENARTVVAYLPARAEYGRVVVSGHDVSGVVAGVSVDAQVGNMTELVLKLKPGSLDIDAEGRGRITDGAYQLLTLLGWIPPEAIIPPPVEVVEQAAEWRRLDGWRLGIERVVCLDPSCPCDADETSILVDDVTELSPADLRQLISNHRKWIKRSRS